MKQSSETPLLHSLPSSIFCYSLCQFLSPSDILALIESSKQCHGLLHQENQFWKILLQRDFGYDVLSFESAATPMQALSIRNKLEQTASSMSIFGVHPGSGDHDLVIETPNAFVAWKHWLKASRVFYQTKDHLVHAPFFLRAAEFWKNIFQWCSDMKKSQDLGARIKQTLNVEGKYYNAWGAEDRRAKPGMRACQAIFSFCGGQDDTFGTIDAACDGLLGGYQAYGYFSCTHLICDNSSSIGVMIGICPLSRSQGMNKLFVLDSNTGRVDFIYGRATSDRQNLLNITQEGDRDRRALRGAPNDDILVWLEEYANRLDSGRIGVGSMGSQAGDVESITLYPRFPRTSVLPIVTEGIQSVSRAVTRGVEVVASSVYVPQAGRQFGYIYSIRIRLLTPEEPGYVSEQDRGFVTCQLQSRHFRIIDNAKGHTEQVNGDGVIGMYPILEEGGYTEDGDDFMGVFQYQSCTGEMERGGSFEGQVYFVPGSLQSPTGNGFHVELKPFILDNQPEYLY